MDTSPCIALQRGKLPLLKQMQQRLLINWDKERCVLKLKKAELPRHFQTTSRITGSAFRFAPTPLLYKQHLGWEQSGEAAGHSSAPDQNSRHEPTKEAPVSAVSLAFNFPSDLLNFFLSHHT